MERGGHIIEQFFTRKCFLGNFHTSNKVRRWSKNAQFGEVILNESCEIRLEHKDSPIRKQKIFFGKNFMTILLETPFNLGDVVCSRLDKEVTYIVNNYLITSVDSSGTCQTYLLDCADSGGVTKVFRPYEIEIVESVSK